MTKTKDDLLALLLAEVTVQLGTHGKPVFSVVVELSGELDAVQAMVVTGEITQEQARLHRQLRLNSFKMSLLALEGISDIALERTLDGLGRVVRRFYGV